MSEGINRRSLLKAGVLVAAPLGPDVLEVDPKPAYELSPYLYMQFMEPLGVTDGSVEASWNHRENQWREDLVKVTSDLAPTMLRWGGIYTDFYRWREGVGPREKRPVMRNLLWGGIESNQVGTAEFVDFSRKVGAEPLICVNFESDGREHYMRDGDSIRTADAKETAEWVAYCNDPDNQERKAHGFAEPFKVPFWQIGNETSYAANGFQLETAGKKTVEFAKAMRKVDPSIRLIGWGGDDRGSRQRGEEPKNWTKGMIDVAGEYLDYVAFHHMFNPDDRDNPVLGFGKYREDPARTWDQLMKGSKIHDEKIRTIRDQLGSLKMPLAMTECHYSIGGKHRCGVLSSWAAGVSYARILNVHERHGDVLKIATAADFCGTRWEVNAVMLPVPGNQGAYLMPVAHVMRLYRRHGGEQAVTVKRTPSDLDVTASRTGDRIFLHVVNTNRTKAVPANLSVAGLKPVSGKVFEIAVDPTLEVYTNNPEAMAPVEKTMSDPAKWQFPAASVSAVEIAIQAG
jgi:alpha-L-arabinofuranosidase